MQGRQLASVQPVIEKYADNRCQTKEPKPKEKKGAVQQQGVLQRGESPNLTSSNLRRN